MISLISNDHGRKIEYNYESKEGEGAESLEEIFAEFVDFTRAIGYSEKSWDRIIDEVSRCTMGDGNYTIYTWASDTAANYL